MSTMIKRFLAFLMAALMLLTCTALAEGEEEVDMTVEESQLSEAELAEIHDLDDFNEDEDESAFLVGDTWHEMELSEVTKDTPVPPGASIDKGSSVKLRVSKGPEPTTTTTTTTTTTAPPTTTETEPEYDDPDHPAD